MGWNAVCKLWPDSGLSGFGDGGSKGNLVNGSIGLAAVPGLKKQ